MKIISVNVGLPQRAQWRGRAVETGIFKQPVAGLVMVRALNLDGDGQADLSVHGGPAEHYAYPAEHYAYWREQLSEDLPWGAFGENLMVAGLDEDSLHIGDCLRVGEAELIVTQPRLPCFKLGVRFGRADMPRRFLNSRRAGFYVAVVREGRVAAGDEITVTACDIGRVTVADITRVYAFNREDFAIMRRIIALSALPDDWRAYFSERLAAVGMARAAYNMGRRTMLSVTLGFALLAVVLTIAARAPRTSSPAPLT